MLIRALIILISVLLAGMAPPALRLHVYPAVAVVSGVRIEASVPRNPANRRLRVEVDGPLYFRAFEEPLEGDKARVLFSITIDQVPDGAYVVTATVFHLDESTQQVWAKLCRGVACYGEEL